MKELEEFENYQEDKWWWFLTYLELGATISHDPKLSAKNRDFGSVLSDLRKAAEELEAQKKRSVLFNDTDDS